MNEKTIPWWVALICLATLAVGISGHEPWTPDEPREAAIAKTIADGGTFLIPRLGGSPFVEKPPLYYWFSALMIRTLGVITGPTAAARAASALCAALTLLIVWSVSRRFWGRYRGTAAALILATMVGFVQASHWILIDPLLMLLVSTAVLFLFRGLDENRPGLILGGYLAGGLAFLTKGFVAWALLLFPWGALAIIYFSRIIRRPFLHLAGFILLLGLPGAWMTAFYQQGGAELWREWLIDNQIGRFSGHSAHLGHIKGPFYYLWLAPLICLPWTPALIGAIAAGGWRSVLNRGGKRNTLLLLSIAWGLGGLLILSLSGTKREVYAYPLLPAFALMIAAGIDVLPRWSTVCLQVLCAIFLLVLVVFSFYIIDWQEGELARGPGINPPVLLLALAGVFSFLFLKRQPVARTAAVAACFYIAAALAALPVLNKVWSYREMTETLAAAIPEESRERVCVWGEDEATQGVFSYYAGIILPIVEDPERVSAILRGEDPEFDLIVVPRLNEFTDANPAGPDFRVVARARKGPRRVFYLICGE
ncbi:MAG: glycosyltransferase family 39 protein [PVC group bacterium]